jgi:hypothetical protein
VTHPDVGIYCISTAAGVTVHNVVASGSPLQTTTVVEAGFNTTEDWPAGRTSCGTANIVVWVADWSLGVRKDYPFYIAMQ